MTPRKLRAVVIGAGWAGEGHAIALQHCGVDVVGICARSWDAVRGVAERLGVPNASIDWRQSVIMLKPDIVTLATPAGLRSEAVELAAGLGCHMLCDKPLAATAGEAERMVRLVEAAGVKHAYASTQHYGPCVLWATELIRQGTIGTLKEIDGVHRFSMFTETTPPWSWLDSLAQGGGVLNNAHTHALGILEHITGGKLVAVVGEARTVRKRAPCVPEIHDFRVMVGTKLTPDEAAKLEWRECDVDLACSALHRLSAGGSPTEEGVQAFVRYDFAASPTGKTSEWHFRGDQGTLCAKGTFDFSLFRQLGTELEPLPIPQRLLDALPQVGDDVQSKWVALMRDFVADIRGEPHGLYLTFHDGWRYQVAIDAIRGGLDWTQVPL